MRFYEYRDIYCGLRRAGILKGMTRANLVNRLQEAGVDMAVLALVTEHNWHLDGRPFYNVFPAIAESLCSFSLEFPGTQVRPPENGLPSPIFARFPVGKSPLYMGQDPVRGVMFSFGRSMPGDPFGTALLVGIDHGECEEPFKTPVYTLRSFRLSEKTIEEALQDTVDDPSFFKGVEVDKETSKKCIRLAVALCMLRHNPDIIKPQVLTKDQEKWQAGDEEVRKALEERARRKGLNAFFVGGDIESVPHMRRPHPALVWYGKGKTECKIIFRKGCLVNRNKMVEVPTGYDAAFV